MLVITGAIFVMLLLMVHFQVIIFPPGEFLPIHSMLEIFTISVCFSIFAVRWMSYRYTKDFPSLLIGVTFMSVGIIDTFHTLTYLGMPPFLGSNSTQLPTWFWLAQRLTMAVFIAVAAFLSVPTLKKYPGSNQMIVLFLIYTSVVVAVIAGYANSLPILVIQGVGLTSTKIAIEYVVIILFALAAMQFWRLAVRTKRRSYTYLTIALFIGIFEELLFTFYGSVYDIFNLSGHLFGLASVSVVFLALFRRSVAAPYEELEHARQKLENRVRERTADLFVKNKMLNEEVIEHKRAEEALMQANKKLNLLTSLTRHDSINQLFVLQSYAILAGEAQTDEKRLEYLANVSEAGRKVQKLLSFARDYQNIGTEQPSWQNLKATVHGGVSSLESKNIAVSIELDDRFEVFSDMMLEKVFYNLMDNALRYGMRLTKVTISSKPTENGLTIIFEDDGVGVPQDEKDRIFEQGYGRNTGMGLYLAAEILGITGMTIEEKGVPGKGARFEIHVPREGFRLK
jgi:signal transduction histidine kinase